MVMATGWLCCELNYSVTSSSTSHIWWCWVRAVNKDLVFTKRFVQILEAFCSRVSNFQPRCGFQARQAHLTKLISGGVCSQMGRSSVDLVSPVSRSHTSASYLAQSSLQLAGMWT